VAFLIHSWCGPTPARDASAVTAYLIKYEGPPSLAVQTATLLADAEGVELTSSEPPERRDGQADTVVLALTVEGTSDAVLDAVSFLRTKLPSGARLEIAGGS
jgi:hypothetical protein